VLGGAKIPFRDAEGGPDGIPSYPLLVVLFEVGGRGLNALDVDVGERGGGKLGRRVEVLNEVRRGGGAAKGSSSIEAHGREGVSRREERRRRRGKGGEQERTDVHDERREGRRKVVSWTRSIHERGGGRSRSQRGGSLYA